MTQKPKILIVDDKHENLISLERTLAGLNIEFVRAYSGNEGLQKTLLYEFAIALVDVQMPQMDGFEMVELLRYNKDTRYLPVIFITAISKDEIYQIKGIEAGAVDFISKPFSPQILKGKVSIILELYNQRKKLERADKNLKDLNNELKRSNKDLEDFTYVVAHDLKAPLRKIISYGDFLVEDYAENLDDDGRLYISRIQDATKKMQNFIDDLLNISRVGTRGGKFEITDTNKLVVNVLDLIGFLKDNYGNLKKQRFIDIYGNTVFVSKLENVIADSVQLRQVFLNLITNAIKFQKKDKIAKVEISYEQQDDFIKFTVNDNGIGIEKKYIDKIFIIFQRVHATEEYEGTGVGLALCKKIIERHGGNIWCVSEYGKGSTFHFTLKMLNK